MAEGGAVAGAVAGWRETVQGGFAGDYSQGEAGDIQSRDAGAECTDFVLQHGEEPRLDAAPLLHSWPSGV